MIVTFFIIIFLVAYFFKCMKWRCLAYGLQIFGLISFLAIGCGWIPTVLLKHLQSSFFIEPILPTAKRTVIVVLGGGTTTIPNHPFLNVSFFAQGRVNKTAALYHACRAKQQSCQVIISGGDPQHHGRSEAAVYADALLSLQVPPTDLILEDKSLNTWQNAQFTTALLEKHQFEQVLLVSSGIHLQRSLQYFAHFGVRPIPIAADFLSMDNLSMLPVAYHFAIADFLLHEYVGMARYHIYNWLGWNKAD